MENQLFLCPWFDVLRAGCCGLGRDRWRRQDRTSGTHSITCEDGAHPRAGRGTVPLFYHHSIDDTVFRHFRHSGLKKREIRVSKQSFCGFFFQRAFQCTYYKLTRLLNLIACSQWKSKALNCQNVIKTISPFALNFQLRNFADIVYSQTAILHTHTN